MNKTELLKALKEVCNGCPLFEDREKGDLDELTDKPVTIEDYFKLSGDSGDYFAVTFKECSGKFFLSGGALTTILRDYGENGALIDLNVTLKAKVRTANKRDFRPCQINDFVR